jgi:hypothetical protein
MCPSTKIVIVVSCFGSRLRRQSFRVLIACGEINDSLDRSVHGRQPVWRPACATRRPKTRFLDGLWLALSTQRSASADRVPGTGHRSPSSTDTSIYPDGRWQMAGSIEHCILHIIVQKKGIHPHSQASSTFKNITRLRPSIESIILD